MGRVQPNLGRDVAKDAAVVVVVGNGTIGCVKCVGPAEWMGERAGLAGMAACNEATRRTAATASVIDRNLLSFVPARLSLGSHCIYA